MEKEKKLKILAVQMSSVIGDKKANFKKVEKLIADNIKDDIDVIILPEVWTVGWKPSLFQSFAEDINGETVNFLSKIAKKYNTNIIGGSFILNGKENSLLYNACPVINKKGELVSTYYKMHLFSYYGCDEGKFVENGQNPVIVDIEGVKFGLSICYDIRFPEIYRAYAKNGAEVLVNMAAWPMSRAVHWEALTKARAIENQCFMVALTQSGAIDEKEWNLGHSRVIGYDGVTIAEIGVGDDREASIEGVMLAELNFCGMNEFRKKCQVFSDIHDCYKVKF